MASWSDVEQIQKVAHNPKIVHVGERLAALLADLSDIRVVVLLQRRLSRQCLHKSRMT